MVDRGQWGEHRVDLRVALGASPLVACVHARIARILATLVPPPGCRVVRQASLEGRTVVRTRSRKRVSRVDLSCDRSQCNSRVDQGRCAKLRRGRHYLDGCYLDRRWFAGVIDAPNPEGYWIYHRLRVGTVWDCPQASSYGHDRDDGVDRDGCTGRDARVGSDQSPYAEGINFLPFLYLVLIVNLQPEIHANLVVMLDCNPVAVEDVAREEVL